MVVRQACHHEAVAAQFRAGRHKERCAIAARYKSYRGLEFLELRYIIRWIGFGSGMDHHG